MCLCIACVSHILDQPNLIKMTKPSFLTESKIMECHILLKQHMTQKSVRSRNKTAASTDHHKCHMHSFFNKMGAGRGVGVCGFIQVFFAFIFLSFYFTFTSLEWVIIFS